MQCNLDLCQEKISGRRIHCQENARGISKGKEVVYVFFDMKKAFHRVPRKVMEWAMRKKGLLEEIAPGVMSLSDGAKT